MKGRVTYRRHPIIFFTTEKLQRHSTPAPLTIQFRGRRLAWLAKTCAESEDAHGYLFSRYYFIAVLRIGA